MSFRLKLASAFIRGRLMIKWLELVDGKVSTTLSGLISDENMTDPIMHRTMPRTPGEFRVAMARKHATLVRILIERKGAEKGMALGRDALHSSGVELGKMIRSELRLSDGQNDLMAAARLLYRILGIEFEMVEVGSDVRMIVNRCSLADGYGASTCAVMSAMDEGVVEGLNPRMSMRFIRKNDGSRCPCEAELVWEGA
ncbi:MAG: hypothetical protein A4E32_00810 [Methanomassiliicoccales archaeon PtaU1.Bin124]|nr:MAG: hypothetical protein A4E32_00810 [Methanomassiliicoccales archaeon PtaU1.Bin124]